MQIFDLKTMPAYPYEEREKNIFYREEEFRARIIVLPPGGEIPECRMETYTIFYVTDGSVEITVNQEKATIVEGQCLIAEPSTFSMRTKNGVRLLGIIIKKAFFPD